ncbi:MAG: 16S rRNA (cytosine(967)-C(5))-methyltransferase RsmB [Ruminococcaceae bacterium]|nr:16S rRNA (cytosine(967)-C(5))-methyltransferase RsmB [Oscillospiraceae bacterium]
MSSARTLAFRSLVKSTKDGKYSNLEAGATLGREGLTSDERALYTRLYLGVTEKKITLDYLLSRISSIPLNEVETAVLCLLELGAYQILYMDRIPDHAAIFETVEIGKRTCRGATAYLNAVLRKLSAEKEEILSYLNLPGKKGLSLRYGYPKWMITLWQNAYGKELCEKILIAQNTPPALTLRINTVKTSLEDYCNALAREGIPFHKNPLCKNGITLEKNLSPTSLYGFEEGLFFVQDAAAQHAVDRLGAKEGDNVLDLCASPGGKSFGAAMDMNGIGSILSLELYESRLSLIREGAQRLGIGILRAEQNDSSRPRADLRESFDRVICDVPCSGYGTIAKKPDIRHKSPGEAETLPALQLAILEAGGAATKKGGRLIYSTCTLNPAENERVTDAFLLAHPEFIRVGEAETIFPAGGENDGFFCDLLERCL